MLRHCLVLSLLPSIAAAGPPKLKQVAQYQVKIAPGNELTAKLVAYPAAHRVYVLGSKLSAIDADTGQLADIAGLDKLDDVVIDPAHERGFAPGKARALVVFDPKTLATIDEIPKVGYTSFIVPDPSGQSIVELDVDAGHYGGRRIDLKTKKAQKFALAERPDSAVIDGNGKIYVATGSNTVVRLDDKTLRATAKVSLPSCQSVTLAAASPTTGRLIAICGAASSRDNVVAVVDPADGKQVATFAISSVSEVVFDAKHGVMFVPSGTGALTVIEERSATDYAIVQQLDTPKGAARAAFDPETGKLYLASPVRSGDRGITAGALMVTVLGS